MRAEILRCTVANLEAEPNLNTLIEEYAIECANQGLPYPNYNVETYRQIESRGCLAAFGAYEGLTLVGFIVVLLPFIPHYSMAVATVETFFVGKASRASGAGILLRKAAEDYAKDMGSPGMYISTPSGSVLCDVMYQTKGYEESNRVFFKRLT